mgnify:CR=1 FL=1
MRKTWKRVVAVLCAAVLIAGAPLTGRSWTVKADTGTETKEWSIISADTKVPASGIYQRKDLSLNLNKTDADRADLAMYMRVTLASEDAVTTMKNSYMELSQVTNDEAELQWRFNSEQLKVGENVICLKFSQGSPQGSTPINLSQEIKHFRIFNVTSTQVSGWADVTLKEVKVAYLAPVVRAYTDGATAGTAPADTPDGYAFAGWYTDEACTTVLSGIAAGTAYAKFVNEDVMSVKAQYKTEKRLAGALFANCDSTDGVTISNNLAVTTEDMQEGTGAYVCETLKRGVAAVIQRTSGIDMSAYQSGRLHLWLYVDDTSKLNDDSIWLELGNDASNRLRWRIRKTQLTNGWNELNLKMSRYNDTAGTVDYSNINFLRLYPDGGSTQSDTFTIKLDDIRVVESLPGITISDCDSTNGLAVQTSHVLATENAEIKEGTGALKNTDVQQVRFQAVLSSATDISAYVTAQADGSFSGGAFHFWLYINDLGKFNGNLQIELGSGGQADRASRQWTLQSSTLVTGWNDITLPFARSTQRNGEFNPVGVNFFRCWQTGGNGTDGLVTIIDDIRVLPDGISGAYDPAEALVPYKADVRFVSTVDTLDYSKIGFDFEITSGRERNFESNTVYTALKGMEDDGTVLVYPPITVAPQSNYFFTYALRNIPSSDFDVEITATPYWITRDGTKVNGISRTLTVNELLNAAASQN